MARFNFKIISLQSICKDYPFRSRYRLEDLELQKSIAAHGILQPLILTVEKQILSGHKRFLAAENIKLKEIPILELEQAMTQEDAFIFSILSNWKQSLSDLDRAFAIFQAEKQFKINPQTLRDEILPALGIASPNVFYPEAIPTMQLSPALLEAIAKEWMPFRGAKILSKWSAEDQDTFASQIAARAALTTNQILKTGEWIYDLLKISSTNLENFLHRHQFNEILNNDRDRKAKGEAFFVKLKALRFPHVSEKSRRFTSAIEGLRNDEIALQIETPLDFEDQGMTLKARLKNKEALDRLIPLLQEKRKVLNSLLDIVL